MRSATFGNVRLEDAAAMAAEYAALTHGHPIGQHASGAFAVMIECLVEGRSLRVAVDKGEEC